MRSARVSFDIETLPTNEWAQSCLATPYDPSTFAVKYNAKDPDKIAQQQREHETEHAIRMAEAAAKGSLHGLTGRICCWAFADDRQSISEVAEIESLETGLVENVLRFLKDAPLSTWNGGGFDLPFVMLRASILGVTIPRGITAGWFKRWETPQHFDGCRVLKWQTGDYFKLEKVAQILKVEPISVGQGSEVAALAQQGNWKLLRSKCEQDVRRTLRVNEVLEKAFPVEG